MDMDMLDYAKKMMLAEKQFHYKALREYETTNLHTPYCLISLMLNQIFGRENEKFYKISWIPIIYHVAMQGMIFNWADIMGNKLSSCIATTLGGLTKRNFEFYMGYFLIDCVMCTHPFPKLNCEWDPTSAPVYSAYPLFWAHRYYSFYQAICKYFSDTVIQIDFSGRV